MCVLESPVKTSRIEWVSSRACFVSDCSKTCKGHNSLIKKDCAVPSLCNDSLTCWLKYNSSFYMCISCVQSVLWFDLRSVALLSCSE